MTLTLSDTDPRPHRYVPPVLAGDDAIDQYNYRCEKRKREQAAASQPVCKPVERDRLDEDVEQIYPTPPRNFDLEKAFADECVKNVRFEDERDSLKVCNSRLTHWCIILFSALMLAGFLAALYHAKYVEYRAADQARDTSIQVTPYVRGAR